MKEIRTERRFGVTGHLEPIQRRNLMFIRESDGWPDLLDVMEMCCIEIETDLINTPSENEAAVVANHKMAKAAWKLFTHMQMKVDEEISLYMASVAPKPLVPEMTQQEEWVEGLLDPTKPQPPDDYMGI
jgi:hypothetical protein